MKKLNVGCGRDIRAGYVNLDIVPFREVDLICDLDAFPYPFADNEFDEVFCQHVLEHVTDLVRAVEELHRILKPGGLLKVIGPYFASHMAFTDPTHKHFMTYGTFDFLAHYSEVQFRVVKRWIKFLSGGRENLEFMRSKAYSWPIDLVINVAPVIYERFFFYYLPASEIHYLLQAIK
jgi:SAM-dependent methyltransferase